MSLATVHYLSMNVGAGQLALPASQTTAAPGNYVLSSLDASTNYLIDWGYPRYTVTNKVLTTNVATLTVGTHVLSVGDVVTVSGVDSVFDGQQTVTAVAATTFSYAKTNANVTTVAATGVVTVPQSNTVTNKVLTSNVATLTIGKHNIAVSDIVTVADVDAVFNGTYTVTAIAATTISYAKTNANVGTVAATGTVTSRTPATTNGSGTVTVAHQYKAVGTYQVEVFRADTGQQVSSETITVA
jgi:hypothetical protein